MSNFVKSEGTTNLNVRQEILCGFLEALVSGDLVDILSFNSNGAKFVNKQATCTIS